MSVTPLRYRFDVPKAATPHPGEESDFRLPEHRRRQIRRGFSIQASTRPEISGTASGELRILGVTDTEAIHIRTIYVGKPKAGTSSNDIRSHPRHIGVSRVSDVIQLPCKVSGRVSFCVTMDMGLDENIIFSAGNWSNSVRGSIIQGEIFNKSVTESEGAST